MKNKQLYWIYPDTGTGRTYNALHDLPNNSVYVVSGSMERDMIKHEYHDFLKESGIRIIAVTNRIDVDRLRGLNGPIDIDHYVHERLIQRGQWKTLDLLMEIVTAINNRFKSDD